MKSMHSILGSSSKRVQTGDESGRLHMAHAVHEMGVQRYV